MNAVVEAFDYGVLNQEVLKQQLHYDTNSGIFTWNKSNNKKIRVGSIAGHNCKISKYIRIRLFGKIYQAHRLSFLYMTGEFPKNEVDHINHNRSDNRWFNLRDVVSGENSKNKSLHINSSTGVTGVYYNKRIGMWQSAIGINKKNKHLGYFKYKKDAIIARKQAEIKYDFHINHGGA